MSKRPSLFSAKIAPTAPVEPAPPQQPPEVAAAVVVVTPEKAKARPPSREGKRVLSIYLSPEAWKQLRLLSLNLDSTTQALGEEAINLLFEKHRLNRIA